MTSPPQLSGFNFALRSPSDVNSCLHTSYFIIGFYLQAQSDDDDVGPDDVNVPVEGGFMDEFFSEVCSI
ncbi:unnamed protein product [Euphydryas editha]|uniref:Uncharacterized protein n=1 Tax=Euphydryas editha TaxID=104508 RepID=A0AAU9TJJ5_EUPED|nr:unnamed protein product [Euphydryas editha]